MHIPLFKRVLVYLPYTMAEATPIQVRAMMASAVFSATVSAAEAAAIAGVYYTRLGDPRAAAHHEVAHKLYNQLDAMFIALSALPPMFGPEYRAGLDRMAAFLGGRWAAIYLTAG